MDFGEDLLEIERKVSNMTSTIEKDYYDSVLKRNATDFLFDIFLAFNVVFTITMLISLFDKEFAIQICKVCGILLAIILSYVFLIKIAKIMAKGTVKLLDKVWKGWWKCI